MAPSAKAPPPKRPPCGYVKFRMPYSAIDVYRDPKTGAASCGNTLDDAARSRLKRDAAASQARYDAWLEDLRTAIGRAFPSFRPCDERPSRHERVIMASTLFKVSIIAENWCFAIRLATDPEARNRGAQVALFPKFCRKMRDILLHCDASGSILVKRSQACFVPLSSLSDADLDVMSAAARIRLNPKRETVLGYNEPAKAVRGKARAPSHDGNGKEATR